MEDPFFALSKSLQSVFHLESMRNGKYIFNEIQQLKVTTDHYSNSPQTNNFIELLRAIKESLPYLEKWHVNLDVLRKSMDNLAKLHQLPRVDWHKVSPKFQFSTLNHSRQEDDLLVWITSKTGKPFAQMNHSELTQALVDNRDAHGFCQKLNNLLKKEPDFLFQLIMNSEKNFIKIAHTRLILHLTDQELATAIVKHIPALVHKKKEPFEQVGLLIHKLNDILSNGRSVSTLLRNAEAKSVLDNSIFFQIYQSEEYQNSGGRPPSTASYNESLRSR